MAIQKTIVQDATGVSVDYHVVQSVTLDKAGKTMTGVVMSYVSAEAKAAGKQTVGYPVGITVSGLPGAKDEAFAFFEKQLIVAKPADAASQPEAAYAMAGSRYMFADGVVTTDV
jgi:hypothetical protein